MRRATASLCIAVLLLQAIAWAGLGSDKAMYVGGTVGVKEHAEGTTSTADSGFVFTYKGGALTIPYDQVNSLEYGQKAGRRLGLAIAISPLFLLSKKRRHFLTIGFLDENKKQQAAVFELGKGRIRDMLTVLETKTGKKVDYEDDEARKSASKS
jgi:hypothetical protein